MNVLAYIDKLKKLNPTRDELIQSGILEELVDRFANLFSIELFNANIDDQNPVLSITKNCNTANFTIFHFNFLREVKEILQFSIFGENEADSVAINNNTGEIVDILYTDIGDYELGDIDELTHITPVAFDQESFLEALYLAAKLSVKIIKNEGALKSKINIDYAEKCIIKAGGEKYRQFWWWFLGCDV